MEETATEKKNVVFLVLDSLRKDRLSVYNESVDFTDHVQRLADSAVVFENAVTQAPWTLPSHASMFTGEYPWEHGTTHAESYFQGGETFVSQFERAGHSTAAITPNVWITPHKGMTEDFDHVENFLGKADNRVSVRLSRLGTRLFNALGDGTRRVLGRQLDRVFRLFDVDDSTKSEETVEAVEEYLGSRSDDENFFLYVNLMEPHEPYHPPKSYADSHGVADDANIPHRQKDMFTMDDIDYEALRRVYDASVDYTDDLVGRIVDALEANDLDEDTVVVLLSDHGQALCEDGEQFGHQFTVAEPVVNTVLLVDHPDMGPETEERPIEMRKLNELVPYYAGIAPRPEGVFSETVKGGIEYPENFTGFIPRDRWNEYYRKYRYVKRDGTKVVKSVDEDGRARYEAYDLVTDTDVPVPDALKQAVDEITSAEQPSDGDRDGDAEPDHEMDEEVTRRLEELGYK
ncbi:sulfatase [Halorientalis pallida]|nr:sulfatase [Halorientalis pallida]